MAQGISNPKNRQSLTENGGATVTAHLLLKFGADEHLADLLSDGMPPRAFGTHVTPTLSSWSRRSPGD